MAATLVYFALEEPMSKFVAQLPVCESLESRRLLSGVPAIQWQSAADSPLTRAEGSKAVVNGKLYIVGGFDDSPTLAVSKELDVYDPVANSWKRLADMPVPETHGATAVVGNAFYVGGFFYNNGVTASKLVYLYNTIANTWTQEPSLPAGRGAVGMAVLNNTLQLWGGLTGQTTSSANHWSLDLNNLGTGWVARAPLPQPLDHMGSVAIDGKIWSLGGFINKEETTGNQSVVYTYDPATDKWSTAASLPEGLGHIGPDTTVAGDKIVIAGGQVNASNEDEITTVFQYDPVTGQTATLTPLPQGRKSAVCGYADGKLIVVCGNQENPPYLSKLTWVADYNPDPTTANRLTGTTIGTPGSYHNDGNTIAKATDGNLSTYFDAPDSNGNWVGVDLGASGGVATQIEFASRSGYAGRMNGGIFQASNSADFSSGVINFYTIPANANPSSTSLTSVAINNSTAYRYYRYLSPNNSNGNVSEVQFYGNAGGLTAGSQLSGTTIGTAGSYQNLGNTIAKATDGSLTTFFDAPTGNGDWVGLDLGSSKTITQIKYAPRSGYASRMIGGNFQISTTADFSSGVTTIYTITAVPVSGSLTTLTLASPLTTRYVRYLSPNGGCGNISEFEVFG
jgi:N-acetylneuraminic acid mutarotase